MKNRYLLFTFYLARFMQVGYALLSLLFFYLILSATFDWSLPSFVDREQNPIMFVEILNFDEIRESSFNLVFFSIKAIVLIILFILSLESLIKIINSIKEISAFKENVVGQFTRIGVFMMICFVVTLFDVKSSATGMTVQFSLEFQYLLFGLVGFVLAEISREGNKLWEENQLTI
jgi:hypothetical protein